MTYQRQQTLRFANGSAIAQEAEEEHQPSDPDEDVHALVNQLRFRESLKAEENSH